MLAKHDSYQYICIPDHLTQIVKLYDCYFFYAEDDNVNITNAAFRNIIMHFLIAVLYLTLALKVK